VTERRDWPVVTLVFVAVLLAAMALDWLVMRRLEGGLGLGAAGHPKPAIELVVPRTLFFHPGHSWARLDEDGSVTVGIDDLIRTLVGCFSTINGPSVGDFVVAGQPAMVIGENGQALRIPAPVSGRVTEVNRRIGSDPVLLRWRPYKEGWVFRLIPGDRLSTELGLLAIGNDAARWMADEMGRAENMFRNGLLESPVEGALERAGAAAWATVERELLGSAATRELGA